MTKTERVKAALGGAKTEQVAIYSVPGHHYWRDDEYILDWGQHTHPDLKEDYKGYFLFKDDGSGEAKEVLWTAPNGHDSYHPNGEWIPTDTYNIDGYGREIILSTGGSELRP